MVRVAVIIRWDLEDRACTWVASCALSRRLPAASAMKSSALCTGLAECRSDGARPWWRPGTPPPCHTDQVDLLQESGLRRILGKIRHSKSNAFHFWSLTDRRVVNDG